MQSQRPSNHADETFGKALENLIENDQSSDAKVQIELIQKNNGSINSVDDKGRSFLTHAIDKNMFDIAKILLELLKDDDVLFSIDQDGRTSLHASLSHLYISTRLIQIAIKKNRLKDYLIQDNAGNTILHAPFFFHPNTDFFLQTILNLLYLKIKNDSSIAFSNFINLVNNKGETALHVAFRLNRRRIISALIKYGANLTIKDHTNVTTILFFAILPPTEQESIFLSLEKDKQKTLLTAYRDLLIKHQNNELLSTLTNEDYVQFLQNNVVFSNLKENYFKLTTLFDLKTYLLALHEFDDRIPLRKTYVRTRVLKDEIIITPNMPWEVPLLEQMPLYTNKLGFITKREYDLENDEDIFTNLVNLMDNFVKTLNNRESLVKQALVVLIPIIWIVGLIWSDSWLLGNYSELNSRAHDPDVVNTNLHDELEGRAEPYLMGGLMVLMFGLIMGVILIPLMRMLWLKELNVTALEYQPILDQLKGILVSRSKQIEQQNKNLSPTMKTPLNKLEAGITELETGEIGFLADFPTPRKPISRVTTIVNRLKDIVENIRSIVMQEKEPLGLKRLPSSIGLFQPKKPSPYRPLPPTAYLEFPEENIEKQIESDEVSSDSSLEPESINIKPYRNYKSLLFAHKNFFLRNTSDEDEALLPVFERKEFTKQEIQEKLLGKDWEEPPVKKSNFRFHL